MSTAGWMPGGEVAQVADRAAGLLGRARPAPATGESRRASSIRISACTSRCCAPSWRSRPIRRRSSAAALTSRAREAAISSARACSAIARACAASDSSRSVMSRKTTTARAALVGLQRRGGVRRPAPSTRRGARTSPARPAPSRPLVRAPQQRALLGRERRAVGARVVDRGVAVAADQLLGAVVAEHGEPGGVDQAHLAARPDEIDRVGHARQHRVEQVAAHV